ncbi:MAG: Uma2 family endonuclease [Leptodesmis sp.]|uniref:Uma2 family endonuclease n=1 Tax=Leptodesmis sp. TaxID=3100501 RepID=UPI003D096F3A
MPPPRLIVEVVSPGKTNRDRDYIHKRSQYAAIGVPEYWLVDSVAQTVMVLSLQGEEYQDRGKSIKKLACLVSQMRSPDYLPDVLEYRESDRAERLPPVLPKEHARYL